MSARPITSSSSRTASRPASVVIFAPEEFEPQTAVEKQLDSLVFACTHWILAP
jgi:hypothetical protein